MKHIPALLLNIMMKPTEKQISKIAENLDSGMRCFYLIINLTVFSVTSFPVNFTK